MGITGLYPYVKKNCPDSIRKCQLSDYSGKKFALDSPNFMYRFLYGNNPGSHLVQFGHLHCDLLENNITPKYVFDGKAPDAKQDVKDAREKIREEHAEKVEALKNELQNKKIQEGLILPTGEPSPTKYNDVTPEKEEEIQQLESTLEKVEKQVVVVTKQHIDEVKQLLKLLGATVIQAHSEGEATCAVLNRLGDVDAVIAEDADVFPFGGITLITGVGGSKNREDKMTEYNIPKILETLEITTEELVEVSILCKSDFSSKIKDIGPVKAISLIKEMYTIENIVREMDPDERKERVPSDFDPKKARKVFYEYLSQKEVYDYAKNVPVEEYSHAKVCEFLKGKVPLYREVANEWCKKITGEWPQNLWDSDGESSTNNANTPKPKKPILPDEPSDVPKKRKNPFDSFSRNKKPVTTPLPPPKKPFAF
jgi:flap endonuclease-1